jgi:hypothetical protein
VDNLHGREFKTARAGNFAKIHPMLAEFLQKLQMLPRRQRGALRAGKSGWAAAVRWAEKAQETFRRRRRKR